MAFLTPVSGFSPGVSSGRGAAVTPLSASTVQRAAPVAAAAGQESRGSGLPSITGAAAAAALLAALGAARRTRRQAGSRREVDISRRAENIEMGGWDAETQTTNYVNPWQQRVEGDMDIPMDAKPVKTGWKFHRYSGPVYKKVPVAEGLTFPLDPELYYPPLEPPAPGAKWGDGRSPDGNWYMDIDGKQVQYWQGVGKRKTACAIVRLVKGPGQFLVNGREAIEFFQNYPIWWLKACEPLAALSQKNEYDILAKTFGGGLSGQAGAVRLALARAMQECNYNWRPLMKKAKYLTRDWRMVRDKMTGQPKARKKTPYHKR
ncbi:unnamed protein product [Polarella glacialis]|uniref:30S ribosomal protein S9, chloroplastic n=1 Tax=Polarella glacialis TaxID=89957 RepID=A0A813KJ53_POLGL|nr:unnamed protein product [Polarella glacialis]CAE8706104.1 unnamed protein product [Polarella glacialis]